MTAAHRVIIIYDGINNSVFAGQVLQPLQTWLNTDATRTRLFASLEREVYGSRHDARVTIEAVSPAMKKHLITTYQTSPKRITLAHDDIPHPISHEQRHAWRDEVRTELEIEQSAHVY